MTGPTLPSLLIAGDQLRELLARQIQLGQDLKSMPVTNQQQFHSLQSEFRSWRDYNYALLAKSFSDSSVADDYKPHRRGLVFSPDTVGEMQRNQVLEVDSHIAKLKSILNRLDLYDETPNRGSNRSSTGQSDLGSGVFIVHGHSRREHEVARVVEKLGAEAIILAEQPNHGLSTLIEKLEREADRAGFAVVLFTGDDEGRELDSSEAPMRRARENVVAELGYFTAKLGRKRVIVLYEPGVEWPSDFTGVIYTELDSGGAWKSKLEAELRLAQIVN
jgi:predicted nucleotide-binding protein